MKPKEVARNVVTGKEKRFDIDYPDGHQSELRFAEYLTWIARGNGSAEVKHKRRFDLDFFVEDSCDTGNGYRDSGIATTTAKIWAYDFAGTSVYLVAPTEIWRRAYELARPKACTDSDNPTTGRLVNFAHIRQAAERFTEARA